MRRQRHLLRISNAEKNQKPDNSMQASKPPEEPASQGMKMLKNTTSGSKKQSTQIEPVIIEGDILAMCPQDRKDNSSRPSSPPMFEANAPTRQAQEFRGSSVVGKHLPSNEAQHNHENTNVNYSDFETQTQEGMYSPYTYDYVEPKIDVSYTRLLENLWNHELKPLCEEMVATVDESMMRLIQGDETIYESSYSVSHDGSNTNLHDSIHYTNFLNSVRMYSLPQHTIKLKIGSHVMLTQNINRRVGLFHGTTLQVLRLGVNVIEAKIISGENVVYVEYNQTLHIKYCKATFSKLYYIMQAQRHYARFPTVFEHEHSQTPLEVVELRRIGNDAFNLLKERSKSALELEYHLENIERAMSNDMDWLNPEGHLDSYSDSETTSQE
ncbi:hypothetical protein CTI12_AA582250 [Artemisia annua]|uniref:DNA helicase Pif1-like 2B domain-containing protein n=1 Tax=Artemisia annua TaxID=35608 RepID=A0A2U1KND8_ARTAN|nr:hypothetical protein CTI12_AA582250 [Artemisia annua]